MDLTSPITFVNTLVSQSVLVFVFVERPYCRCWQSPFQNVRSLNNVCVRACVFGCGIFAASTGRVALDMFVCIQPALSIGMFMIHEIMCRFP